MKQKQKKLWLDIRKNAGLYALVAIPIIWYIVFKYIPMYGFRSRFEDSIRRWELRRVPGWG